ncbi:hypothetical protein WJX84_006904 [Apatococcus fuscideae]|uniref:SEC7 domain-containing protein n=1 Tax=Apatococcus fuscideae TaxID=2026836 RepID=A0AAW1SQ94_9CHLO
MSRQQSSTNGFADPAQSALVASSVGPYRPANVDMRKMEMVRDMNDMQLQPSLKAHAQRLNTLRSNVPAEFRPGSGEQGISNLSSWMTGTVPSSVASSTQDAMPLDSPLASQDGNNLTGVFHQPSDSMVHTMPESSGRLPHPLSMSTIYSENRQRSSPSDFRSSGASEDPQVSSTEPFLPPPEPSATSPTPLGSRRSSSTAAELQVVAKFLRNSKISLETIGAILGDSSPDSQQLLNVYTGMFNFQGLEIDEALRNFLNSVWLQGETQKIERMLEVFAQHYYTQNPSVYNSMEAARTMAYSLIMLNMNLHNPKVPRQDRMKLADFFKQMRKMNVPGDENFPEELLEALYNRRMVKRMLPFRTTRLQCFFQ